MKITGQGFGPQLTYDPENNNCQHFTQRARQELYDTGAATFQLAVMEEDTVVHCALVFVDSGLILEPQTGEVFGRKEAQSEYMRRFALKSVFLKYWADQLSR
jgi:hypothetical protein